MYLVWVRGVNGFSPQVWTELYYGVFDQIKKDVSNHYKIDHGHQHKSLHELSKIYPCVAEDYDAFGMPKPKIKTVEIVHESIKEERFRR